MREKICLPRIWLTHIMQRNKDRAVFVEGPPKFWGSRIVQKVYPKSPKKGHPTEFEDWSLLYSYRNREWLYTNCKKIICSDLQHGLASLSTSDWLWKLRGENTTNSRAAPREQTATSLAIGAGSAWILLPRASKKSSIILPSVKREEQSVCFRMTRNQLQ